MIICHLKDSRWTGNPETVNIQKRRGHLKTEPHLQNDENDDNNDITNDDKDINDNDDDSYNTFFFT